MILRTPPPKRPRPEEKARGSPDASLDKQLIVVEELPPAAPMESSHEHSDHMLCTYQCRQMVKSDFLDALSNAEKQVEDYRAKLETLNKSLREVDAERKKFRDQFLYAEQELAAARGREKVLQQQLLKDIDDSQERYRKQLNLNAELERNLQNEKKLRQTAESSSISAEEKWRATEKKLSQISESMERERKLLNNELAQRQRDSEFTTSKLSADLERMELRAKNAEEESELLSEQMEHLKNRLNECLSQKSEVEKKLSDIQFQEATSSDEKVLIKNLQQELRNYESEVREARKLKHNHEDIEIVKEKLLEEKRRKERAELEFSRLQERQLNMTKLENEILSWKSLLRDIPGVSSPDDITVKFAALQKEVLDGTVKMGEATARLKQVEVALDAAELGRHNAEIEAALSEKRAEALKSDIRRIEMTLSMVTEERDKLRNDVNELRLPNEAVSGGIKDGLSQELEASLAKKESYIKDLERELNEQQQINKRQHEEIKFLNETLNDEARRIKSLEREGDRLRSEIFLLESKLGHGDFSAANTKVLRMINTLAVDNEVKQTIEALRAELEKTKEKLQAVEELKSQSGNDGKPVDSLMSGKIVQLKEQIATLEKREERYKTVFADRISVFRRACCELFGYKIVMDERQHPNGFPVTRFTLQSIYAQSDDEKLEFDYESGNTSLVGNAYSSQREIAQQVEVFVRKFNSIPAFTANLTMESFNKRTLS